MKSKFALILPTLNAGSYWDDWIAGYRIQTRKPDEVLVIDSSSDDDTRERAAAAGFRVHQIKRAEFDHGGTRRAAVDMLADADIVVMMTQDAILADEQSIHNLLRPFADPRVGATYGRQLPRRAADPIEAHARLFNYPDVSRRKSLRDSETLGIKTAFCSNSFAAYRRGDLVDVGNFPDHGIFGEDMYVAARLLLAGLEVHYAADARVYHSHSYRLRQEFKRSFDIGAFHALAPWLLREFGAPHGEGKRFVLSEARYLLGNAPALLGSALARTLAKYAGYRLGRSHERIPTALKKKLSMAPRFWT